MHSSVFSITEAGSSASQMLLIRMSSTSGLLDAIGLGFVTMVTGTSVEVAGVDDVVAEAMHAMDKRKTSLLNMMNEMSCVL